VLTKFGNGLCNGCNGFNGWSLTEEGRRKRAEGGREKGKREEGRLSRREGRGEKEEARKSFSCLSRYSLVIVNHNR